MAGKSINSKSVRRNVRRMPGGRLKIVTSKKMSTKVKCPVTGKVLRGVPRVTSTGMGRISKSKRAPSRPFGGVLSTKATKAMFIKKAREENA